MPRAKSVFLKFKMLADQASMEGRSYMLDYLRSLLAEQAPTPAPVRHKARVKRGKAVPAQELPTE